MVDITNYRIHENSEGLSSATNPKPKGLYFLEYVTIATTAAVAIDYGILSIVSPNLD